MYNNDSYSYNIDGQILEDYPCQAVCGPTYISFDSRKRDVVAFPDINNFNIYFPVMHDIYAIYLREFQFPLFASLGQTDWVNVVVDHMPVVREGLGSHNVSSNTRLTLNNITLQAPNVETSPGSGTCIWHWKNSGQKPVIYTPRNVIQQLQVQLLDSLGAPLQTGVVPGSIGPPMRFLFAVEHK